jgi:hypothetical protein
LAVAFGGGDPLSIFYSRCHKCFGLFLLVRAGAVAPAVGFRLANFDVDLFGLGFLSLGQTDGQNAIFILR